MSGELIVFFIIATICVLTAGGMVISRNPVHSGILLVLCFINIAAIFVMLGAEFLGIIQIIVYTGAILVLLLFVLMLVDPDDLPEFHTGRPLQRAVALILGAVLLLEVVAAVVSREITGKDNGITPEVIDAVGGNTQAIGLQIFTEYLLPFELISMVLTVGILGAIVLALPDRLTARAMKRRDTISLGHPRGTDIALPVGGLGTSTGIDPSVAARTEAHGVGRELIMANDPNEQPVTGQKRRG